MIPGVHTFLSREHFFMRLTSVDVVAAGMSVEIRNT